MKANSILSFSAITVCCIAATCFIFYRPIGYESFGVDQENIKLSMQKHLGVYLAEKINSTIESKSSIDSKKEKEKENSSQYLKKIGLLTGRQIYEKLISDGVDVDAGMKARIIDNKITDKDMEWLLIAVAAHTSEEDAFRIDMTGIRGFSDIKKAYQERSKKTGIYYGNEILNQVGIYKDVSLKEISDVLNTGAVLPENLLEYLIANDNTNLALQLKDAGYSFNVNYYNESSGMNALESQVEFYTWAPTLVSLDKQLAAIQNLIDIGVPLKVNDGTRDALDISLEAAVNYNESKGAERLMDIAENLHKKGFPMEDSHFELLNKLKLKYPDVYKEYISEFN